MTTTTPLLYKCYLGALFTALLSTIVLVNIPRVQIPSHLLDHPAQVVPELIPAASQEKLLKLIKEMREFPTNAKDTLFYKLEHEHIGEAEPIVDGKCTHPLYQPNLNKTACILPNRVDVGRHYIMYGGESGLKNSYESMISRVQSFGRYMFNPQDYPDVMALFESETFITAARETCPKASQYLDAFQFNFIIQSPGQVVPLHIDAPYFWGATRFEYPQWLLAVMAFSGLFQKEFVDQVQVVGYLHKWTDDRAGDFIYWNTGDFTARTTPPTPRTGSTVDGSKVVHAATTYHPTAKMPYFSKDADNVLTYVGNDQWVLLSNGVNIWNYTTDDLRITIVYRARCFKDAAEAKRFNDKTTPTIPLPIIISKLASNLVAQNKLTREQLDSMTTGELALFLLDSYTPYPLPLVEKALIPINYCALPRIMPWTAPLLRFFC